MDHYKFSLIFFKHGGGDSHASKEKEEEEITLVRYLELTN